MSHVKLSHGTLVTQVEVDGHLVKDVTRVQMDFPADDIPQMHLGIAVTRPFEWEGDAEVNLHLHVPEGCKLIEVTTHTDKSGTKKWMVAKVTP